MPSHFFIHFSIVARLTHHTDRQSMNNILGTRFPITSQCICKRMISHLDLHDCMSIQQINQETFRIFQYLWHFENCVDRKHPRRDKDIKSHKCSSEKDRCQIKLHSNINQHVLCIQTGADIPHSSNQMLKMMFDNGTLIC